MRSVQNGGDRKTHRQDSNSLLSASESQNLAAGVVPKTQMWPGTWVWVSTYATVVPQTACRALGSLLGTSLGVGRWRAPLWLKEITVSQRRPDCKFICQLSLINIKY